MKASPERLREARTAAGLSQAVLATRTGIHFTTYNRYEKGRIPLRDVGTIIRIAGICGVGDFRTLLEDDEKHQADEDEEAALRRVVDDFAGALISAIRQTRVEEKPEVKA